MKYLWILLLCISTGAQAGIGKISELQGTTVEIKRGSNIIKAQKNTEIESNDTVSVGSNTTAVITFADNSTAKISANSKLLIDDFVYDPTTSAGKTSMKVALGTVRMVSGNIGHNNAKNVNIKTPTAAIAVRGTDFAMTVDELGRSTVVLLPTCKDDRQATLLELPGNCKCGAIDVMTDVGKVSMESPFYATYVANIQETPLPPVRVDPQVINAAGEGSLNRPQALQVAVKDREQKKDDHKDKSKANEDERKASKDSSEKELANKSKNDEETIKKALAGEVGATKTANAEFAAANPCWPFTGCGNEKGYNWYEHVDPLRGNVINIRTLESSDNTTYNISVNNVDISQRQIGSGANGNVVTVRQWNR
jgi:hypothetical protein